MIFTYNFFILKKMTSIENFENYVIFQNSDILNVNSGKYLKPFIDKDGYKEIILYKNGKQKKFKLHRLLALAYIPNPENKKEIDHINRDRSDNRLENLRWATNLENSQNKGMFKNNTSGEKNISKNSIYWEFQKRINNIRIYKCFETKEEAIEFKKEFYKDNNLEYV